MMPFTKEQVDLAALLASVSPGVLRAAAEQACLVVRGGRAELTACLLITAHWPLTQKALARSGLWPKEVART